MFKYRVINHWDNADGSVERGYSGRSLFFRDGKIAYDEAKVRAYAALLQKCGVNVLSPNNVNVSPVTARLITGEFLPELAKLAGIFREYGIRLLIAVEFSAPISVGGLRSCDPLNRNVADWWCDRAHETYEAIPDLAGFLVKADSEFRVGPAALGRTQADGANVLARALAAHGGVVFWRCFVYNCMQDWRDAKTDRAKAAYDTFFPLDGEFADNVILQIKNGPMDFQVREPLSPLLSAMKKTRLALEFQITQEYTGQQIDLYAHAPQWAECFNSPISEREVLADICGEGKRIEALCAVGNAGDGKFLTGHPLAEGNVYAFGRFGQDPKADPEAITRDWVTEKFGKDIPALTEMLLKSREVYENYNSPLGLGWLVNTGHHYGPSPDGYEFMKWGTYHKANHRAVGVERTSKGTGFTAQYDPYLTKLYDDINTTPEELLLFFHRVPYAYKLKSGKTLIQRIYDTHFLGAAQAEEFVRVWELLKPQIPPDVHAEVAGRFKRQLENAREWRDVVNTFFRRLSDADDERGRKIYD